MIFAKIAADLDSNPKVREAGRDGRDVFLFALRKNAAHDFNGCVPSRYFKPKYLAEQLMTDEVTAGHGLSRSVTAGLLTETDDGYLISGWDDEWSKRPLTDAERKRRQRSKTINPITLTDHVTKRHESNVTKSDSHACHALDQSREEEKRVEEKRAEAPPGKRKSPEVRLPVDWRPDEQHSKLAAERSVDLTLEAQRFRAHAETHERTAKNWNAAFRQWLLKSFPDRKGPQRSALELQLERVAMLEREEAEHEQA